jgi:hypothetical protein
MQPPRTREDSGRQAAFVRAENAGALVDTILATPAALQLRVGDSIAFHQTLHLEARDAAGATVEGFVPLYTVRPVGAAKLRHGYLVALAEGTTALVITPVRAGAVPPNPLTRPAAKVVVTIVPR